jgi:hypothetical protein
VATTDRLPLAALGFGIAAALSSWNPLSAPLGAIVGLVALLLAARALQRAERRQVAIAAFGVSFVAVLASAIVLARTAGIGRELGGAPVVKAPPSEEVKSELDQAAERTRASRERARKELDALGTPPSPEPPQGITTTTR